jgi:serine/threonine protein kinase
MLTIPSHRLIYCRGSQLSPPSRQARRNAPNLSTNMSSTWWTDERIDATINRQFVCSHLTREEQERLDKQLGFGDGLTDNTYLDWILSRARRLFLILVDIGVPDQIFYVVDESYDDDDLPIAAGAVANLRLTYEKNASLEKKFYKTQFQYLIRSVKEGEHVRYKDEESVPIEAVGYRAGIPSSAKDGLDKVHLPGSTIKVYTRKRIVLNEDPDFPTEDDVLAEVNSMKQLKHDHIVSVYGSYTSEDVTYVLLLPSAEWALKTFLTDPPQLFKSLEKRERREILVKWPHCLASALAYLHRNSRHHGDIRSSNVFVDSHYRIFFGYLDIYKLTRPVNKRKDVEAYEYAAPERWIRAPVVQETAHSKTTLHSGGRTARKVLESSSSAPSSNPNSATSKSQRSSYSSDGSGFSPTLASSILSHLSRKSPPSFSVDSFHPSTATTSNSYAASITSSSRASAITGRARSKSLKKPLNYTPSIASSNSSTATTRPVTILPKAVAVPSPQLHSAIISTWQSQQHDPFPSDIFAFGAITLEILTHMCKRKLSSFAWHRSCKNRTAGRGGAPADASYHANIKQVGTWIKALKRVAFDKEDPLFRTVERMLDLCGQMIVKEPESRPTSEAVEDGFAKALAISLTEGHCSRKEEVFWHEESDIRPTTAGRRSVDNPEAPSRRGVPDRDEAKPALPELPPKLVTLLGQKANLLTPLEPSLPPSLPHLTDLNNNHNASSSSLASSAFSFETSGFRWDDFEDDQEDLPLPGLVELPRQDSITTIPEIDFLQPIRHSSVINAEKFDIGNGGPDPSFVTRIVRTRTPQSAINFSRNWPLPSAGEVDDALCGQ